MVISSKRKKDMLFFDETNNYLFSIFIFYRKMRNVDEAAIEILEVVPDLETNLIQELKSFILKTSNIPSENKSSRFFWFQLCDVVGPYVMNNKKEWQRIVVDMIHLGSK